MNVKFYLLFMILSTPLLADVERFYAPTVYQGLGSDPSADEFTSVNFDGDWNPKNNWDNMMKFKRPPVVYYDVMESENHYFITYGFFFPRDYASPCFWIHCHENDFEGMRVTVKKPSEVLKLEGLAHGHRYEVLYPQKIEVTIEKEGHGIHPRLLRVPDKKYKTYQATDYELRSLKELWDKRDSDLFTDSFIYNGNSYSQKFGCHSWCLFNIGGARPPWSWKVGDGFAEGQWFFDPLKGSEKYLRSLLIN